MSVEHYVCGRGIRSFNPWPGDPGEVTVVDMVWDESIYKDNPRSITNPPLLNAGEYAACHFQAYCSAIDFEWKFTNGGSYTNGIGFYWYQGNISDPETTFHYVIYTPYSQSDWYHEHVVLPAPGVYNFVFGVLKGGPGSPQGWIDNIEFTPTFVMRPQQAGTLFTNIPCIQFTIKGYAPTFNGQFTDVPRAHFRLDAFCPGSGPKFADIPCARFSLVQRSPAYSWSLPVAPKPYGYTLEATPTPRPIYTLTLTGGNTGTGTGVSHSLSGTSGTLPNVPVVPGTLSISGFVLTSEALLAPWYAYDDAAGILRGPGGVYLGTINYTSGAWNVGLGIWTFGPTSASYQYVSAGTATADIVIPMSSFTLRLRNGDSSYLNVIVPDSKAWQVSISARTTGDLIIKKGYLNTDGTQILETIVTVDFESVAIDRGDRSDSATLVGQRTITFSSPVSRTIIGASYYGLQTDATRRIRAPIDTFLRPGDTCIYGSGTGESFVVGEIQYIVDDDLAYMEVSEIKEE